MTIPHPLPPPTLVVDLETVPNGRTARIFKLGALRTDTGERLECNVSPSTQADVLRRLDEMAAGAHTVLGHNIIAHDLPILRDAAPGLALLTLPVTDTLRLSPLAFPQNPYHRLLKDYKLVYGSKNSPLADCDLALTLFGDQYEALRRLGESRPDELRCYQALLTPGESALDALFRALTGLPPLPAGELAGLIPGLLREDDPTLERASKVCRHRLQTLLQNELDDPGLRWPLAYALAWLRVSGGNSVLAPWVRHQFPQTGALLTELRDIPCGKPDCSYCRHTHDPRHELRHYFGFPDFRLDEDGGSLQHDITLAGMRGKNVLAILPTSGGKSLCYQLPALNRFHRNGSLTVIVSPLQSLMKDQVDGLLDKSIHCGATLNGLLTLPERADTLEKIRMGDAGILLVSPEQFRNPGFRAAIAQRQVGAWIFDEAHCLSKWGNDFRPDYLYVARFIQEFSKNGTPAPIGCFTATARLDVIADIRAHFREELGIEFHEFSGGHERNNLHFDVFPCAKNEKCAHVHALLKDELKDGGAVVFVASRKHAEEMADFLQEQDWPCKHFHAGLEPHEKKDIQDDFKSGKLRVIVATNAFGMGVDKQDIRLVIHADIPGSLENYLQEAGRAGRDRHDARCVLLYDPEDIETQFGLSERSRVGLRDIQRILKKLRYESARRKGGDLVITAGEILTGTGMETSFTADERGSETKVVTAIAWLERGDYLRREENRTQVFPARLDISEAETGKRLAAADLPASRREEYRAILACLREAKSDERISTDQLMLLTRQSADEIVNALRQMESMGLLVNDQKLTIYLRHGVVDTSKARLERSLRLEKALLDLLPEEAPDAGHDGSWQGLHPSRLSARLKEDPASDAPLPLHIVRLLRALAQDRDGEHRQRGSFALRQVGFDYLELRIQGGYSWRQIAAQGDKRRRLAARLVEFLIAKLPPKSQSKDLLVETSFGELAKMLESDLDLASVFKPSQRRAAIEHVLLYLHNQEILTLNHGMTVMRRAMTIIVNGDKSGRYTKTDYERLDEHYRERRIQVHVMREYAEMALEGVAAAFRLVLDYFTCNTPRFMKRYFAGREAVLKLATSEESWQRIVEKLSASQRAVVTDDSDRNRLVLAGPGSGKTSVVVHRIAYLLRVRRVPAAAIIALTFNRHAAAEIRQRLDTLVGADAWGLTVMTYHSMAMRLTGVRFAPGETIPESRLDEILENAAALLEGRLQTEAGIEDDLRERLLRGYRYILVDEYQDIDERQYRLVSALAGRSAGEDERLCLLAVGDDDQNIYAWRETSNRYIERFRTDYDADIAYLVENYRSSARIIEAANHVIAANPARLKADHPIRIDEARRSQPPGGIWQARDPDRHGRVLRLRLRLPQDGHSQNHRQVQAALGELTRLLDLENRESPAWHGCAILARMHRYLHPARAWCEQNHVPYWLAEEKDEDLPPLIRRREFVDAVDALRASGKPTAAEARDLVARLPLGDDWQAFFRNAFDELGGELGDCRLAPATLIDWLYEYARELRQHRRRGLALGTVHSAKGLEFRHVVLLDGAWQAHPEQLPDERRIYYVGMTRAQQTLTLCEFGEGNPFSAPLDGEVVQRTFSQAPDSALDTRYQTLSLKEIDIGFPGSHPPSHPIHAAIRALKPGDNLQWRVEGERLLFLDREGRVIGRSAYAFQPDFEAEHCDIAAIFVRYANDGGEKNYHTRNKCERWELVVPRLIGRQTEPSDRRLAGRV
ncbi:MAG: RecQ family ATP-dependent DNA helicase [Azoarcus sp.]|nr:RecQ family ATP-dependent DNA helicase [Azoarcus sp.]